MVTSSEAKRRKRNRKLQARGSVHILKKRLAARNWSPAHLQILGISIVDACFIGPDSSALTPEHYDAPFLNTVLNLFNNPESWDPTKFPCFLPYRSSPNGRNSALHSMFPEDFEPDERLDGLLDLLFNHVRVITISR